MDTHLLSAGRLQSRLLAQKCWPLFRITRPRTPSSHKAGLRRRRGRKKSWGVCATTACLRVVSRAVTQGLLKMSTAYHPHDNLSNCIETAQGTTEGCRHALGLLGAVTFVIVNSVSPNLNCLNTGDASLNANACRVLLENSSIDWPPYCLTIPSMSTGLQSTARRPLHV